MKKFIAIILLAMVMSGLLIACKNGNENDNNTAATSAPDNQAGGEQPEQEESGQLTADGVPELDFEGYEIVILNNNMDTVNMNITMEAEATGEVIDDAANKRSLAIQERLNCKIREVQVSYDDRPNIFRNDALSGDSAYDISMLEQNRAFTMAQEGLIYNINNLQYIDLDKPWYDQNARQSYSIANQNFFVPGAYELSNFDMTRIVIFNKNMVRDYGVSDNLYELVKAGEWTYNKFFDLAKLVSTDVNGDGKFTEADKFGVATTMPHVTLGAFMAGAGEQYVGKDSDDLPYFSAGSERFNTVFMTLVENLNVSNNYYFHNTSGGSTVDAALNTMFMEDRLLFYVVTVNRISYLRSMDSDFGILPAPKFNAEQANYHCESGNGMVAVIPQSSHNPDKSGAFLELYAYYGYEYVVPAYKETAIKTKHARDEESMEMLDIIDVSRFYDLGRLYWPDNTMNRYRDAFQSRNADVASITEKFRDAAQADIAKGIEMFVQ